MGRERDVFARLAQKLALATAEAARLATGRDEHAEDLAFHEQRGGDERTQSASRQTLRERKLRVADIRFVDQLPPQAMRQAVSVYLDLRQLGERELHR